MGILKTLLKINILYFLPGINKFVETRIENCVNCLRKAKKTPKHKSVITHSARDNSVWGCVSTDFINKIDQIISNVIRKEQIYLEYKNRNRMGREELSVNDVVFAYFNMTDFLSGFYYGHISCILWLLLQLET